MRTLFCVTVIAASFSLISCETEGTGDSLPAPLMQRDWQATSIAGQAVVIPNPVTLTFSEDRVAGRSGCNQYSGAATYDNHHIKIGPMISTKMACIGDGIMEVESKYLNAMQSAQTYAIAQDGKLTIEGALGPIVFEPRARQVRP